MGRRPISRRIAAFIPKDICGISWSFLQLSHTERYVTYVLLTRSPLGAEAPRSTCMC
jgi:hypothetical protein